MTGSLSKDYRRGRRDGWRMAQRHYDKMLKALQDEHAHEIETIVRQVKANAHSVALTQANEGDTLSE